MFIIHRTSPNLNNWLIFDVNFIQNIRWILYLFGTFNKSDLFADIYPYYIFMWFIIIDLICMRYIKAVIIINLNIILLILF
jgi:hypothetical protein